MSFNKAQKCVRKIFNGHKNDKREVNVINNEGHHLFRNVPKTMEKICFTRLCMAHLLHRETMAIARQVACERRSAVIYLSRLFRK